MYKYTCLKDLRSTEYSKGNYPISRMMRLDDLNGSRLLLFKTNMFLASACSLRTVRDLYHQMNPNR